MTQAGPIRMTLSRCDEKDGLFSLPTGMWEVEWWWSDCTCLFFFFFAPVLRSHERAQEHDSKEQEVWEVTGRLGVEPTP